MIACSKRERFEYVLTEERNRPKAKQTVFICQPLALHAQNQVEDIVAMRATASGYPAGTANTEILRYGLVDWRGMYNAEGEEIKCETDDTDQVPDRLLELIPSACRTEIANAIWSSVDVTDTESKN